MPHHLVSNVYFQHHRMLCDCPYPLASSLITYVHEKLDHFCNVKKNFMSLRFLYPANLKMKHTGSHGNQMWRQTLKRETDMLYSPDALWLPGFKLLLIFMLDYGSRAW